MDTFEKVEFSVSGNRIGVAVGSGVFVAVGSDVLVGGTGDGVDVNVEGTAVGTGVEAGVHPLNRAVSPTNTSKID
jgi:hypothetical protein